MRCAQKNGKREEVIAEMQNFIKINPGNGKAYYGLGTELMEQGNLEQAVSALREAARLEPNQSPVRVNLASALRKLGKFDDAISQYREGLRILPAAWEFHLEIARILLEQGKIENAISEYRIAVQVVPNSSKAHNDLSWFLTTSADSNMRDPAEALVHAKKAVDLEPKAANVWNTLGVAHYRNDEWRDAITALKKSEELLRREGRPENWLFLAMAHWQLGQKDEARQWHDKAVEWMKNNPVNDELSRFRAEADELQGLLGIVIKPEEAKEDLNSLPVDKNNK